MDRTINTDDWANRAFQLAYFIHGDRTTACRIAGEALAKLEIASVAQDKRLYYKPASRLKPQRPRTKVSFSELHLLQRLIYLESESYEREKERRQDLLNEEDMIIHFVKHLVEITIRRNSFYVMLGLSRLLHNYTTVEAMALYSLVAQDPERVGDDHYYRSRKKQLMRELKDRFGQFLAVVKGQRGEERFESLRPSPERASLIRDCLNRFTPWTTPCVVPQSFDPFTDTIAPLSFAGRDPDEEHSVEVNRFHAIIDPQCYSQLVGALGFDSPDLRLEIPLFSLSHKGQKPPRDRRRPPGINEEELLAIKNNLDEQAARRRWATAGLLKVMVDGKERARLDPNQNGRAQFKIGEGARLIEVRAVDERGELPLAIHLIAQEDRPSTTAITLEGGQKLLFAISWSKSAEGEFDGATVNIAYQETGAVGAATVFLRRLKLAASERLGLQGHTGKSVWKPALAFAFFALLAAGLLFYIQSRKDSPAPQTVDQTPPPSQEDNPISPSPAPESDNPEVARDKRVPDRQTSAPRRRRQQAPLIGSDKKQKPARQESSPIQEDIIVAERDPLAAPEGVTLAEVKKVYVEAVGGEALGRQVREMLAGRLPSSGRLVVTQVRDESDAVLKVQARRESVGTDNVVTVRLVNAGGYVIWPGAQKGSGGKYTGKPAEMTAKIIGDLLDAIQSAEKKR
jgi:hypothetical protein